MTKTLKGGRESDDSNLEQLERLNSRTRRKEERNVGFLSKVWKKVKDAAKKGVKSLKTIGKAYLKSQFGDMGGLFPGGTSNPSGVVLPPREPVPGTEAGEEGKRERRKRRKPTRRAKRA
jgi:hypothetical protein